MAMGGMKNLPGMPGSKGGGMNPSQNGYRAPRIGQNFSSNVGAGYSKPGMPSGLSGAFNVPKYGSGGGIGGGIGLGSYGTGGSGTGLGAVGASVFDNNRIG